MRITTNVTLLTLFVGIASPVHSFELAQDSWCTQDGLIFPYDKLEHALRGSVVAALPVRNSAAFAVAISLVWEVKDGFLDYHKYGRFIGGDGFSYRDIVAELTGIGLTVAVRRLIK